MNWQTPKTNWGVDVVGSVDFNRIEGNIYVLHKGNGFSSLQTMTPFILSGSNYAIDINVFDEVFVLSRGNSQTPQSVNVIYSEDRQAGNKITLILVNPNLVAGSFNYATNGVASGYYKPIKAPGNFIQYDNTAISFVFDGNFWYPIDRSI